MSVVRPSPKPIRFFGLAAITLVKSRFIPGCASHNLGLLVAFCFPLFFLAASYLGHWLPVGDSLAVFRAHLEFLAAFSSAIFFSLRKPHAGAIVAASFLSSAFITPRAAHSALPTSTEQYSVYQKNLLISGETPEAIAADIIHASADFVALQELSPRNLRKLAGLFAAYRNAEICPGRSNRGVAILTKLEIIDGSVRCFPDLDLVLAQVGIGDEKLWLGSVHLRWPFPHGQHSQAKAIENVIAELDGRIIISGDFNMVRDGSSVRRIERAAGARVAGDVSGTFPRFGPLVPLTIDHVLLPSNAAGVVVETRPLLGSDHFGLLARFSL